MNTSNSMPPKTPGRKRPAAALPSPRVPFKTPRLMPRTPVRVHSHHHRGSSPHTLTMSSPSSARMCTPDRFIPNRGKMNVSQARRALFRDSRQPTVMDDESSTTTRDYQRHLQHALLGSPYGQDLDKENPILAFGSNTKGAAAASPAQRVDSESPYRLDVLRSSVPRQGQVSSQRAVTVELMFTLDAPQLVGEDCLNLASYGPVLAAALLDRVYLRGDDGKAKELVLEQSREAPFCLPVTAVQWSPDGHLLAIGFKDSVQIWIPQREEMLVKFGDASDCCTAIAWKEASDELVIASGGGLFRYSLRTNNELIPKCIDTYQPLRGDGPPNPHHPQPRFTSLQWRDAVIASAGEGKIDVWDTNLRSHDVITDPARTLLHPGVRSIEFCPTQPNVLVSGGDQGLRFWNVQSGSLRAFIPTESLVTKVLWSPFQPQVLASHGKTISLWSVSPKIAKLTEQNTESGKVTSMTCDRKSGLVICTHVDERVSGYQAFRHAETNDSSNMRGRLIMPVIR